jgi:hypothetical protein
MPPRKNKFKIEAQLNKILLQNFVNLLTTGPFLRCYIFQKPYKLINVLIFKHSFFSFQRICMYNLFSYLICRKNAYISIAYFCTFWAKGTE